MVVSFEFVNPVFVAVVILIVLSVIVPSLFSHDTDEKDLSKPKSEAVKQPEGKGVLGFVGNKLWSKSPQENVAQAQKVKKRVGQGISLAKKLNNVVNKE
jgi:hypothetical protein